MNLSYAPNFQGACLDKAIDRFMEKKRVKKKLDKEIAKNIIDNYRTLEKRANIRTTQYSLQ